MAKDGLIFGAEIPFARFCSIEVVGGGEGRTELEIEMKPEHLNNLGIAHGGLVATLLDVAMGTAARSLVGHPVMTLDMNVSFLNPGRGTLRAAGRVVKAGRSIVFCEATITDPGDEPVARASGTLKIVYPKPAPEPEKEVGR